MEEQITDIRFPKKGINKDRGFASVLPPDDNQIAREGINVRLCEAETQRLRGGSRAALVKVIAARAANGQVQLLGQVVFVDT